MRSPLFPYFSLQAQEGDDGYAVPGTTKFGLWGDAPARVASTPYSLHTPPAYWYDIVGWEELLDDPSFLIDFEAMDIVSERRQVYEGAMTYLLSVRDAIKGRERHHWIRRRLSIMPSQVPAAFVGFLEREDGVAIALLSRYYGLMKFIEGCWWQDGTAEYEIGGLVEMMSQRQDMDVFMEWPRRILHASGLE